MRYLTGATALLALLAVLTINHNTVHAAKEGDWAGGWNTWATAAEGDWAEYAMEGGITVHWEVKKVLTGKVTYTRTTFSKGKQTAQQELTRDWNKIKLQASMPGSKAIVVEWKDEDMKLGDKVLTCQSASWLVEQTSQKVYFCKDVPCGGIVKTMTNGKDIVWLTRFGKAGEEHVVAGGSSESDEPVATEMPRFFASTKNKAVYKITRDGAEPTYQLRRVTRVAAKSAHYSVIACDASGTPSASDELREIEQTKEKWDQDYASPAEKGVKLKVGEAELVCDVFKTSSSVREITEWVSEGMSVKMVMKSRGVETTLEVVSYHME